MRLEVTRRAGLAVRAVAALAPAGRPVKAVDLAAALATTAGFVPQVIGPLVKAGWVRSIPGPTGGYALTDAASAASVLDVVEAVDGPTENGRCVVEGHPCGSAGAPCALHAAWATSRAALLTDLARTPAVPEPSAASHPAADSQPSAASDPAAAPRPPQ
ncbi:MAG: Rrf2 family transcriptional regulator [Austwickia sp.]|jgi:Rrf2 family iron-sulfur cluster assembly transcriptional regulator|nr:MAG: Rrf2 family transcriptional regulator [Austwickia sp.]